MAKQTGEAKDHYTVVFTGDRDPEMDVPGLGVLKQGEPRTFTDADQVAIARALVEKNPNFKEA